LKEGKIDKAAASDDQLVDEIIRAMNKEGYLQGIKQYFPDKRKRREIPFELIMALAIAAKMRVATSLTDIPYAITNMQTLQEIGYALWESERSLSEGLMDEGSIRHLVGAYKTDDWIHSYNAYVQSYILPRLDCEPSIHILDCTKIEVNMENDNYEGASIAKDGDGAHKGYKLSTLRGICGDRGIIEEIRFGGIKVHDLELSREMVENTQVFQRGDKLINDRGFISRDMINHLKGKRGVDTYIPLRKGMDAYNEAVRIAIADDKWAAHPNKKRKTQQIAHVEELGVFWRGEHPEDDVEINACVVRDCKEGKEDEYYVFVTTAINDTAKQIIKTYELRPEIEEDYRQIKDFWKIENFRSRKLVVIVFHLVCTLLGYLFFQVFTLLEEGE
jgi:hypothetical protein